jgi:RES domain-containing protein
MILRPLQPAETFYRFNTPRWACSPTSGVGASKIGGRFNRPGTDALYLSRRIETAAAEYQQGEPLMPPGTLVTYAVELSSIVDFQEGYSRGEWDELWRYPIQGGQVDSAADRRSWPLYAGRMQ